MHSRHTIHVSSWKGVAPPSIGWTQGASIALWCHPTSPIITYDNLLSLFCCFYGHHVISNHIFVVIRQNLEFIHPLWLSLSMFGPCAANRMRGSYNTYIAHLARLGSREAREAHNSRKNQIISENTLLMYHICFRRAYCTLYSELMCELNWIKESHSIQGYAKVQQMLEPVQLTQLTWLGFTTTSIYCEFGLFHPVENIWF